MGELIMNAVMNAVEKNVEVGITIKNVQWDGYHLYTFQEDGGTRYAVSTMIRKNGEMETLVFIADGNWVYNYNEVYAESHDSEAVAITRHAEIASNLAKYLD